MSRTLLGIVLMACGPSTPTVDDGDHPTTATSPPTTPPTTPVTSVTSGNEGWLPAGDAASGQMLGGVDLAVGPDGALWVSWVDGRDGEGGEQLRVARSRDGSTFEPSVRATTSALPLVAWWGGAQLHVDADTIALIGPAYVGDLIAGYVWVGSASDLSFAPGQRYGEGLVEMVSGALAPDGDLWVSWLHYPQGGGADVMLANSDIGVDGEQVNGALGSPSCECCPLDLIFTAEGAPRLGWRDNNDDIREMAVASAAPGETRLTEAVRASSTGWFIDACPVEGPRLAELSDGRTLIAWADKSSGPYRVYVADSADAVTWSVERAVAGGLEAEQQSPRVVVSDSGTVWLIFHAYDGYYVISSEDDAVTWTLPEALVVPDHGPIVRADLSAAGGQVWVGGEAGDGAWVLRLE